MPPWLLHPHGRQHQGFSRDATELPLQPTVPDPIRMAGKSITGPCGVACTQSSPQRCTAPELLQLWCGWKAANLSAASGLTLRVPLLSLFPSGPSYHVTSFHVIPSDDSTHLAFLSMCVITWEQLCQQVSSPSPVFISQWEIKLLKMLMFGHYSLKDLISSIYCNWHLYKVKFQIILNPILTLQFFIDFN